MSFTGKVAIVTGAASGIGAATAKALAREGAKVVLVDIDEEKLKEVAKQYKQYGDNLIVIADVTKDEDVRAIVNNTIEHFGELHVLVNNAGIVRFSTILDEKIMEHYDLLTNTMLRSVVHLTHLAAPHLIKTKGNIVNTSSIAALRVFGEGYAPYSVAKAGVHHFTRCVALDLAPHGIRVNSVSPGGVLSNLLEGSGVADVDGMYEAWKTNSTALKRITDPEEIADLILFLASDKARSITGSTIVSDNGALLM